MNGHQENAIPSPDATPDLPVGMGQRACPALRINPRRLIAAGLFTLIPGVFWCLEPWQRPDFLRVAPDTVLLALASLGLTGAALLIRRVVRWRWALAVGVCGLALLAGMRLLCGKSTLSHFESRLDKEIAGHFPEGPRKPISERLAGTLKWLRLGVPDWLSKHAEQRRSALTPTTVSLIASSRWPLRRALADSLVRDGTRAEFLLREWKRFFPAITGADVTLEHRRDFFVACQTEGFLLEDFNDGEEWGMPWDPLAYPGGGTGIPWEEDELSASLSWSSNFGRLTRSNPDETTHLHPNSAFRFIALGVFPRYERINPMNPNFERRVMPPLSPPFESTPWQKARELHLRRPDLHVR